MTISDLAVILVGIFLLKKFKVEKFLKKIKKIMQEANNLLDERIKFKKKLKSFKNIK